jgi:cysteine-rich repeat protein
MLAMMLAGCLAPDTADCPGGGVCPAGLVCRLDRGEQACVIASCGNGVVEAGESCDDGNNDSGDSCAGDCVTPPLCGDGVVDSGEDCDDGNRVSADGCEANCRFAVRPPARSAHAMAYDSSRGVLVLFGGHGVGWLNDTWEWNGTEWIERDPPMPKPRPRGRAAMIFDPVRNRILLFGGMDAMATPLGDFWEWDGTMWREITRTTSPEGRNDASMAFDTTRGVAVLFGGQTPTGESNETWEWDGSNWELEHPATSPSGRANASMAFDASRAKTVLVGGRNDGVTWMWDGSNWTWNAIASPTHVETADMAYDRARARLIRFGGYPSSAPYGEGGGTWAFAATSWTQLDPAATPPAREGPRMTYVDSLQAIVVFGGIQHVEQPEWPMFNDLWSWDGTTWREHL